MKNKNGFTLMELLVVIVLLAVLALLVYPVILNSYNASQKKLFLTESKNIYKICTNEYRADIMNPGSKKRDHVYFDDDTKINSIDESFKYCVKLDEKGNITNIKVATEKYFVEGDGEFTKNGVEIVKFGDFSKFDCTYELKEEDVKQEVTIEQIRNGDKYKNALKYLLIAFGVTVVLSIITGKKTGR